MVVVGEKRELVFVKLFEYLKLLCLELIFCNAFTTCFCTCIKQRVNRAGHAFLNFPLEPLIPAAPDLHDEIGERGVIRQVAVGQRRWIESQYRVKYSVISDGLEFDSVGKRCAR